MAKHPAFVNGASAAYHQATSSWASGVAAKCSADPFRSGRYITRPATVRMVSLTRDTANGTVKRVVVTGTGLVSCFGTDSDQFYDALLQGKSGVRKVSKFDVEGWSTDFAATIDLKDIDTSHIGRKNLRRFDPFLTYALVAAKNALENAGIPLGSDALNALQKDKCGVLCGSGMGGLDIYSQGVEKLVSQGYTKMSPFFIPYAITNMVSSARTRTTSKILSSFKLSMSNTVLLCCSFEKASALIGMDTGFMGPNYSVSTACATGNFMINNAALHIRRGECDLCLAGGAEAAIVPVGLGGFIACKALSSRTGDPTRASRPWDVDRDGFVMGEGGGLLVLESLEHALARGAPILAEYLGGAQSCDAYHITNPRQDGEGVRLCIERALADAGVAKERVNYINAHATSTPAGDMAEYEAVRSVFSGDVSHLKMNATKSMIGHALGAAGALEAIATVKAIETGKVHPTINIDNLEPEVDIDIVANVMQEHQIDVGISNSFGFGGHNATVCFSRLEDL